MIITENQCDTVCFTVTEQFQLEFPYNNLSENEFELFKNSVLN